MSDDEDLKNLLDDDEIRKYFMSRDPERKKVNPFLTIESEEQYNGKASALKVVASTEDSEEKEYGISYSQYQKQSKSIAFRFTFIGINAGLLIAIILKLFF